MYWTEDIYAIETEVVESFFYRPAPSIEAMEII